LAAPALACDLLADETATVVSVVDGETLELTDDPVDRHAVAAARLETRGSMAVRGGGEGGAVQVGVRCYG